MRIIGLDVGSTSAVSCCLSERPSSFKSYFEAHKKEIKEYPANRQGIYALLALEPDIAILEPSGIHYAELWYRILSTRGVKVLWVGHVEISAYRRSHRLPSKNDRADALALACYGWEHLHDPDFFLRFTPDIARELRRYMLQLQHLNRIQTPIVNCTRQYLAHEFPEAANRRSQRQQRNDIPALWGWLAGERPSPYFDRLWANSVAQDFGLEISDFTRAQAGRICDIERQQDEIEQQTEQLLAYPCFDVYHAVFDEFGMGLRVRALLLSHIYPLEDFLSRNYQPICEAALTKVGYTVQRNRSLRAFKLRLGFGLVEDSSGKSTNWIPGGSSLCRQALWQWVITRIEPNKGNRRLQTQIGQRLGKHLDHLKAGGVPVQVARMRVAAKAVVLMYKELVKAVAATERNE